MNLPWLNTCSRLTFLLTLTQWIGTRNRLSTLTIMLFPVALLSPATASEAIRAVRANRWVRLKVPRLAELLSMSTILRGVLGTIPFTMPWTPASLPTRPTPPRRWFVALTSIMLVLPVPVEASALNVIDVGLEFTLRWTTAVFVWLV